MSLIVKESPGLCITFRCIVSLSLTLDQLFCIPFSFTITFPRVQGSPFVEDPSHGLLWLLPYVATFKKALLAECHLVSICPYTLGDISLG